MVSGHYAQKAALRPIIIHTTIFQIIGRDVRFGRYVLEPIPTHTTPTFADRSKCGQSGHHSPDVRDQTLGGVGCPLHRLGRETPRDRHLCGRRSGPHQTGQELHLRTRHFRFSQKGCVAKLHYIYIYI